MSATIDLTLETTPQWTTPTAAAIYTHRISSMNRSHMGAIVSITCECGHQSTSVYNEERDYSATHADWNAEKDAHVIHAEHVARIIRRVAPPPECERRHLT